MASSGILYDEKQESLIYRYKSYISQFEDFDGGHCLIVTKYMYSYSEFVLKQKLQIYLNELGFSSYGILNLNLQTKFGEKISIGS